MKFTVVSGAPCGLDDLEYLKNNADRNSKVIAADHGYETCKSAGIMPDIIVGDLIRLLIPIIIAKSLSCRTKRTIRTHFIALKRR